MVIECLRQCCDQQAGGCHRDTGPGDDADGSAGEKGAQGNEGHKGFIRDRHHTVCYLLESDYPVKQERVGHTANEKAHHAQRFKFHPGETSSFILISHVVVHHGRVPAHAVEMGGHIHGDAVGFQLRRGGLAADGSFRKRIGAGILKDELVSEGLARLNGGVG